MWLLTCVCVKAMYTQIVYKDRKLLEMNSKLLEMDRRLIDVQELVGEKQEVIHGRDRVVKVSVSTVTGFSPHHITVHMACRLTLSSIHALFCFISLKTIKEIYIYM